MRLFLVYKGLLAKTLVGLILYVSVNSYGHVETVSSPTHTFSKASLTKWFTNIFCHILSLVPDNNLFLIGRVTEEIIS